MLFDRIPQETLYAILEVSDTRSSVALAGTCRSLRKRGLVHIYRTIDVASADGDARRCARYSRMLVFISKESNIGRIVRVLRVRLDMKLSTIIYKAMKTMTCLERLEVLGSSTYTVKRVPETFVSNKAPISALYLPYFFDEEKTIVQDVLPKFRHLTELAMVADRVPNKIFRRRAPSIPDGFACLRSLLADCQLADQILLNHGRELVHLEINTTPNCASNPHVFHKLLPSLSYLRIRVLWEDIPTLFKRIRVCAPKLKVLCVPYAGTYVRYFSALERFSYLTHVIIDCTQYWKVEDDNLRQICEGYFKALKLSTRAYILLSSDQLRVYTRGSLQPTVHIVKTDVFWFGRDGLSYLG